MKTLLIDDCREIVADVVARTFDEGIAALRDQGPFSILYLDHDLNTEEHGKNGYGIMCYLEENPHLKPEKIVLVTSNPVGRQNMQRVIDKLYG